MHALTGDTKFLAVGAKTLDAVVGGAHRQRRRQQWRQEQQHRPSQDRSA